MKRLFPVLIALIITGCGTSQADVTPKTSTENTEVSTEVSTESTEVSTESTEVSTNTSTETIVENDPEVALMVNKAFLMASDYERTLETDTSKKIKGSTKVGDQYNVKSLRMFFMSGREAIVQGSGDKIMNYAAYPLKMDPIDIIDSEDFSGLKKEGDVITGNYIGEALPQGEVTLTLKDGILSEAKGEGFKLSTDFNTFPKEWLSDDDTFTVYEGSPEMLTLTGTSTYKFDNAEEIVELGKNYSACTDEGNGVTFHLTYDKYKNGVDEELEKSGINAPNYVDPETLTLDDIYISKLFRYGDMKGHTLGDVGEIMYSLRQFQLSQNDSILNKKRSSDKWFSVGSDTEGLPRWYFELVYGDFEERQETQKLFDESGF